MYNIYDYINYYKDTTLENVKWNIMDDLICSCIVYSPIKEFHTPKDLEYLNDEINKKDTFDRSDLMTPRVKRMLRMLVGTKRYKDLKIIDYTDKVNAKTQFGAMTFKIGKTKIVSFKGSDGCLIGWQENFRLAYDYPTYTHTLAINYLNAHIDIFDKDVYVCGHSKGGNLALVSSMEINDWKFRKIKEIHNFDGPGLRKTEFESEKYLRVKDKLINIVPETSYVGVLMYSDNLNVVTTNELGINVHFPTSWNVFGEHFVIGKLSLFSKELHISSTKKIENLDYDKVRETMEMAFKSIKKEYSSKVNIKLKDFLDIYKGISGADKETTKYIITIVSAMIKGSKKK